MDDEGAFLASLSDDDWAKRTQRVEREFRRDQRKRNRRRRIRRTAAVLVPTLVLGSLGIGVIYTLAQQGASDRDDRGNAVPVLNSLAPTQSSAAPNDPFALTPAVSWPNADVGVLMPAATGLGPFGADLVQASLDLARQYLVMTHADPAVVEQHNLTGIYPMLVPSLIPLLNGTSPANSLTASSLAPGVALLAPVRANGSATATYVDHTAEDDEHVNVAADFVWAYAVTTDDGKTRPNPVVVRHDIVNMKFYLGEDPAARIWLGHSEGWNFNIDCELSHQGLLSLPRSTQGGTISRSSGTSDDLSERDMFDPLVDITALTGGCIA